MLTVILAISTDQVQFGLTLATDFVITVVIVYGLFRVRTGWTRTDSKLKRLIVYVPALLVLQGYR